MSPDKTGLLKAFLGGLPGPVAARLASAVETDRMLDGNGLPHSAILESLRPILKRDQFERTLTPLRLFCHPFQDLLTCTPRRAKQKAAIARGTLVPVWIWVQRLIPRETGDYVGDVKTLLLKHQVENAFARAAQFWPLAGAAITRALDGEAARVAAQSILGDAFAVEDAVEMALLLAAGAQVEKLAALLPKPVPSLQESLLWEVRGVYDAMTQSHPDAAPYVAVITMNRLARPWEALRLPLLVTRKNDDTLIAKTDMGLVGEILFGRMDSLKTSIEQTRHPLFNADRLMAEVRAFAELSSNIVKEIELKRDGEWGRRLLVERAMIGKVMEDFMDRAPREVAAALPMQKSSADFSRLVSAEKQEMAVRYARLVTGSRNFAAAASFGASQKASYDALCTALQRYNEDLVNGLKSADPARAQVANAQLALCAELTAILFSEEEADLLRRRGKAAQSAAA